jgi:hypothetical protein
MNFRANLNAQNAGNAISKLQTSKIDPPLFIRGMLATQVAFSHSYPSLKYYLTERSLFKKYPPPPHGKILKKGPDQHTKKLLNVCLYIKFTLLTTPYMLFTHAIQQFASKHKPQTFSRVCLRLKRGVYRWKLKCFTAHVTWCHIEKP